MDINRIRYFCVVAETRHLRKAAEILNMNPGSLSKAIKTLEEESGLTLITPSGRGIQITDTGLEFYRSSLKLLSEYERLSAFRGQRTNTPAPLRLGSFEVFTTYFMRALIEKEFPTDLLRVHELTPGKIEDAVEKGEIDAGITYIPYPREAAEHLKIGRFSLGIYGPKKLLRTPFEDLPFAIPLTPVQTPASSLKSLDGWPNSIPRKIRFEFEMLETALQSCRSGWSALYCPDFVVRLHNLQVKETHRLVEFPLPGGLKKESVPIYLVKRRDIPESSVHKKIARFVREISSLS